MKRCLVLRMISSAMLGARQFMFETNVRSPMGISSLILLRELGFGSRKTVLAAVRKAPLVINTVC